MEDKRIAKTKKNLKNAMIAMLGEKDFEHITITELCREAEVSRITFYSHYNDKYALLDEIFDDMLKLGTEDYYRRQRENNPTGRLAAGLPSAPALAPGLAQRRQATPQRQRAPGESLSDVYYTIFLFGA